jgi:hypothetical protein
MMGKRTFLKALFASPAIIKETASQIEGALKDTYSGMDVNAKTFGGDYLSEDAFTESVYDKQPWWKTELDRLNLLKEENPDWHRKQKIQNAKSSLGLRMDPNVLALRSVSDSAKVQITIDRYVKNEYKQQIEALELEKSRSSWEQFFRQKIFGNKHTSNEPF